MENIKNKIKNSLLDIYSNKIKRITVILFLLLPIFVNLVIETLSRRSFIKCIVKIVEDPYVFIINVMIIYVTFSFVLLIKNRIFGITALSCIWIGFGIANFVLRSFRETPFSASDLSLIGDAFKIINKYMNVFGIVLIVVLFAGAIVGVSLLWIKIPAYAKKINYFKNLIIISIITGITILGVNIGLLNNALSLKFSNLTEAYFDYGFVYGFTNSLINTGVKKPNDYSSETIEKILNKLNSVQTVDKDNVNTPNIIFLQLESFFNINEVKWLELSQDPTPYFNSLKEKYPSGYLNVNNVGYGTANTEFEVITGMNLDDFGPGEFPYKTILKDTTCESICYNLRAYGYVTHAMHNNTATFYSRHRIFSQLGFDTFIGSEAMDMEEYTPLGWAKDIELVDEINKVLDSSDGHDFIYAISVQGHGSYPTTSTLEKPVIKVTDGLDEERVYAFEYYVNQIYEMDLFVKALVESLEARDEKTVLVMYGDHLPSLELVEDDLKNGSLYQTEYVMWNNFGLQTSNEDLETYQVSSKLMQALNIDNGYINKFHQIYRKDSKYLESLHTLEYDILYGSRYVYGGENPYIASDIDYILDELTILDVVVDDKYVKIKGKNFTKNCGVYINEELCKSEYIDSNTIRIKSDDLVEELHNLDAFTVKLLAGDTVLTSSSEFLFIDTTKED